MATRRRAAAATCSNADLSQHNNYRRSSARAFNTRVQTLMCLEQKERDRDLVVRQGALGLHDRSTLHSGGKATQHGVALVLLRGTLFILFFSFVN